MSGLYLPAPQDPLLSRRHSAVGLLLLPALGLRWKPVTPCNRQPDKGARQQLCTTRYEVKWMVVLAGLFSGSEQTERDHVSDLKQHSACPASTAVAVDYLSTEAEPPAIKPATGQETYSLSLDSFLQMHQGRPLCGRRHTEADGACPHINASFSLSP